MVGVEADGSEDLAARARAQVAFPEVLREIGGLRHHDIVGKEDCVIMTGSCDIARSSHSLLVCFG